MKARLFSLLPVILLCNNVFGQVTVQKNEFYYVGDVVNMIPADPTGTSAGAAGAGVTWDFSTLVSTGGMNTMTVEDNTSGEFSTANLIFNMPGSKKYYVQENNTDSYLTGVSNSTPGGDTIYYYNLKLSRRPISYMTYYTDTYTIAIPSMATNGRGYVTSTADGYGTIITPRGTYNNVLRVKRVQAETDTTGTIVTSTTMVSYMWFDSVHRAPLLRIDSTIGVVGAGNTIMYQAASTGIEQVAAENAGWRGHIQDNDITVFGNLVAGNAYYVEAYNIVGERILNEQFTAHADRQRFTSARYLNPGIYIVTISPADNRIQKHMIKVVK